MLCAYFYDQPTNNQPTNNTFPHLEHHQQHQHTTKININQWFEKKKQKQKQTECANWFAANNLKMQIQMQIQIQTQTQIIMMMKIIMMENDWSILFHIWKMIINTQDCIAPSGFAAAIERLPERLHNRNCERLTPNNHLFKRIISNKVSRVKTSLKHWFLWYISHIRT